MSAWNDDLSTYKIMKDKLSETHSISAGLDYPGVGPEHSHLKDIGRCKISIVLLTKR